MTLPWVSDITYIPTWAGFLYLAVVLDAFSRRHSALGYMSPINYENATRQQLNVSSP